MEIGNRMINVSINVGDCRDMGRVEALLIEALNRIKKGYTSGSVDYKEWGDGDLSFDIEDNSPPVILSDGDGVKLLGESNTCGDNGADVRVILDGSIGVVKDRDFDVRADRGGFEHKYLVSFDGVEECVTLCESKRGQKWIVAWQKPSLE